MTALVPSRLTDVRKLALIVREAVAGGYGEVRRPGHAHLDLAMDCEDPFGFTLYSRGCIDLVTGVRVPPLTVTAQTRCRRCFSCKARRSKMWAARAIAEWQAAPVTAFGTFTLSPYNHLEIDNRARRRLREKSVNFDTLSASEMFTARAREFGAEVTNWLKRIRVGRDGHTPTKIRYLLVAEVHDSGRTVDEMRGRPHFHMLLHDYSNGSAIKGSPRAALEAGKSMLTCDVASGEWECRNVPGRKPGSWRPAAFLRDEAFIRKNWTLGFTKFQWAEDAKSAYYVCKYLSKSMNCRVRGSLHYGDVPTSPGAHVVGQPTIGGA